MRNGWQWVKEITGFPFQTESVPGHFRAGHTMAMDVGLGANHGGQLCAISLLHGQRDQYTVVLSR